MKKSTLVIGLALAAFVAKADIVVKDGETVAFMGDSITQQGNGPVGYVNLVMKGLEVAGVKDAKKIPAGISGHKSNDMLRRLDGDVLARRDGKRAQWMTLSCGVNDVWHQDSGRGVLFGDYTNNVTQILDKCAAAGVKVIVLTATMFEKGKDFATFPHNVKVAPYNEWLRAEAKRRNLLLADLNQAMWDGHAADAKVRYTRDGVHMLYEGNQLMAWGVLQAMGVPAEKKGAIFAAWDEMPGHGSVTVLLNKRETEELKKRAAAEKLDESGYIRKQLGFDAK